MLIIYRDVIDVDLCDTLIEEHKANLNKSVLHPDLDQAFENRVLFLQRMSAPIQETVAILALEIGRLLNRHFNTVLYPETISVVRWSAGDEMALHHDGQSAHTQNRTHSVIIYLNDQAAGGEIYFPEIGTLIAPKRCLMLAYDKTLRHGVNAVQTPRYTLTLWYSDREDCSIFRDD